MISEIDILVRIIAATLFGLAVGTARRQHPHPAGLRTFAFICLGSALYTIASITIIGTDPGRVAAQVVTGVGFLGAGAIWKGKGVSTGLTTAAGIWATAALGLLVGLGQWVAAIASLAIILALFHFKKFTRSKKKKKKK